MKEESLKEKTAEGLFWGGFSTLIQQVLGSFLFIIIARLLTPDDYGLIAMLSIFTAVANILMDAGFVTALVSKKEIKHEDYNAVFWFTTFGGIALYVVLYLLAPLISKFYNQPVLKDLSRLLFLSFLFSGMGISHNAILIKKMKIKQRGIIDIVAVISSGIIGIILAIYGFSFWGLAIQQVIQNFVGTLLRWYYSSWRPSWKINLYPIRNMFYFSSKVFINNILGQICSNLFSVLIGKKYTPVETGYYSQGNKWMSLGNSVVSGMLQSVILPVFSEIQDDQQRQKKAFRKILRFAAFVTFPSMLGLCFVANDFIRITLGEKWVNCIFFLQILSVAYSLNFIALICNNLLYSCGKSNRVLYGYFVFYGVYLMAALFFMQYGINYLVIGCSVVIMVANIFWFLIVKDVINISLLEIVKDIIPYLLITLFSFFVSFSIGLLFESIYIVFFVKIILSAAIYLVLLWILKSTILLEALCFLKLLIK